MMRMTLRAAVLGLVLLISLYAGQAAAHAFLVQTTPEDSSELQAPPTQVVLRFNEAVTPARIELLNEQDEVLTSSTDWRVEHDTVRLSPPQTLPSGVYRVAYRVTSADGHPVVGFIQFGIGVKPGEEPMVKTSVGSMEWIAVLVRAIHYFAVLAGMGGGLFWAFVLRGQAKHSVQATRDNLVWVILLAAWSGVLLVGLSGAALDGGGATTLFTTRAWSVGARSTTAAAAVVVLLASLLSLAGLWQRRTSIGMLLLSGGALMGALSFAVTGHIGTAPPRSASIPLVFMHGLAAAFWVGSLWPLSVVLRHETGAQALETVQRFSRIAVIAVAILVATGVGMSLLQSVSSVEAVTQTGYGAIWGIKMLLVLLLIGIAVWNRIAVTPMLHTGGRVANLWLRRNVFIEIALVIAVLTLTATFALTPPPRTLPQFAPTIPVPNPSIGYSTVVTSGGWTALINVVPARTGSNRIQILLTDADGHNRTAGLISEWTQATDAHTSEPIVITHDPEMIGVITLPSSGRWRVRLRWTDSDDRTHVLRFSVPILSDPAATHGEAS
ncbi:TPA: copper resistance protein CopC [Pseudomonas aeruginosa]|nr:copper resistance protein CopC [Pseudomonas aeruginosa]HEO1551686.1 copper resistance protein CopC [Pseudomonas aeruginosa]